MKKHSEKNLRELQDWFGKAISEPLPEEYETNPLAVSKKKLKISANATLNSKGDLDGFSRLGIYNQQYWFRLITIMQGEYPCLVHLLGLKSFNQLVIQYLQAHPPSSPYLNRLDQNFEAYFSDSLNARKIVADGKNTDPIIQNEKVKEEKEKYLQCLAFDHAFSKAVDALDGKSLASLSSSASLANTAASESGGAEGAQDTRAMQAMQAMQEAVKHPLVLAPYVSVLKLDYDFLAYRALCLQDESLEQVFDLNTLSSSVVIYRDQNFNLQLETISEAARRVLGEFKEPSLLVEIFSRLEGALSEIEQRELEINLSNWFQLWVKSGWLCVEEK